MLCFKYLFTAKNVEIEVIVIPKKNIIPNIDINKLVLLMSIKSLKSERKI